MGKKERKKERKKIIIIIIISRKTYLLLVGHIMLNFTSTRSKFRSVTHYVIVNM